MKLRWIIFINCIVVTGLLTLAMVSITHFILLGSYAALEQSQLNDGLQRTRNAVQAESEGIDLTLRDYATWDETYQFAGRPNPNYGRDNLAQVTMQNLKMRMVLIVNHEGRIILLQSFPSGGANNVTNADQDVLVRIAKSAQSISEEGSFSGLASFSDGPALVAARHVLPTSGAGPSRGIMVMTRELDYHLLATLSTRVKIPLVLTDVQRLSLDRAGLLREVRRKENFASRVLSNDDIAGFTLVNDAWGEKKFLLEVQHDRAIWHEGMKAARILNLSILLLGLIFGLVTMWRANQKIVRPLEKITGFARAFRDDNNMVARLKVEGSAEIVQVASQINEMLDEIQLSNQKLVAARERLKFEATHDALTGTWNCAAALELLDREIVRSEREGGTVAVLMLDLDHFKWVNDQFGHQAGDLALQTVSASIAGILRSSDVLARYGGEEFLVIAPGCSATQARGLAERILFRLQSMPIQVGEHKARITASIGIAAGSFPYSSEELIALADRALYRAKENGRNCAEIEEAASARVKGALYSMPRRNV